jgi:hypothetical protein
MSNIIIGLGSGRCGTVTLSTLLSNIQGINVKHELKSILPWKGDVEVVRNKISQISKLEGNIVGDVAFYYLNYVLPILKCHPKHNIKFVCLRRNKAKTVESFYKIWGVRHSGIEDKKWQKALPKYMWKCDKRSLRRYWEEYYKLAEQWQHRFSSSFKIFETDLVLNDKQEMSKLFDFVEISEEKRIYTSFRKNLREETKKIYDESKSIVLT